MIVFEGLDGSGKTTQIALLRDRLSQQFEPVLTREPTGGPWGQKIRLLAAHGRESVTPERESEYFLEDRKEDLAQTILPALHRRQIVLVDRYFYSNMAYQGSRGLDPARIKADNLAFARVPESVLILDVPPEVGIQRITGGRQSKTDWFETSAGLARVAAIYDQMRDPHIIHVDGCQPVSAVQARIWEIVAELIERRLCAEHSLPFRQWASRFPAAESVDSGTPPR
jgi:dTMP kinase